QIGDVIEAGVMANPGHVRLIDTDTVVTGYADQRPAAFEFTRAVRAWNAEHLGPDLLIEIDGQHVLIGTIEAEVSVEHETWRDDVGSGACDVDGIPVRRSRLLAGNRDAAKFLAEDRPVVLIPDNDSDACKRRQT